MQRTIACIAMLGAALLSACASPALQTSEAARTQAQGSPLLANATDASLGLTFPRGQTTKTQVLQNFGAPSTINSTADGGSRIEFTYTADTRNCNHRRVLTHTAVFQFDANNVVTDISLRHGVQWVGTSMPVAAPVTAGRAESGPLSASLNSPRT